MRLDPNTAARIVAEAIRQHSAPLLARIDDLERRLAAAEERAAPLTEARIVELIATMTRGLVNDADIAERINRTRADLEAADLALQGQITALPMPKDGQSVSVEDVRPLLASLVSAIPRAKDGEDGRAPSPEELLAACEAAIGPCLAKWELDFERRANDTHTRLLSLFPKPANGEEGKDGKDGRDAFELEHFKVEQVTPREFVLCFERGGERIEHTLRFDVVLDAGPYVEGKHYEKGDAVTFAGGLSIAQRATNERPQTPGSDAWRLAVRRGRDGKDGSPGLKGDKGEPGRDLTPQPELRSNIS